jgi:hypothetical protein
MYSSTVQLAANRPSISDPLDADSGAEVARGRWGRSTADISLSEALAVDEAAVSDRYRGPTGEATGLSFRFQEILQLRNSL